MKVIHLNYRSIIKNGILIVRSHFQKSLHYKINTLTSIQKKATLHHSLNLIDLFDEFITQSIRGKRTLINGNKIRGSSCKNYFSTRKLLKEFFISHPRYTHLIEIQGSGLNKFRYAANHWKRFYKVLTNFMSNNKLYHDNYIGFHIKNIKTFLSWLEQAKGFRLTGVLKCLFVNREEIPIITLTMSRLQQLFNSKKLPAGLNQKQLIVKDIFAFGCICGLRFSDLIMLTKANLITRESDVYLETTSSKTQSKSRLKLPLEGIQIINRYHNKGKRLFPYISNAWFNICLKQIGELAGWTEPLPKFRSHKGKLVAVKRINGLDYRFCDHITSHTMRRTAITLLLMLGVPELVVKQISGHSPGSVSFYRYVNLAQSYMNSEVDKAFDKIFEHVESKA